MDKDKIIEAISKMSVLELAELVKALEEKFKVSAAMPMALAAAPASKVEEGEDKKEEKTMFTVELTSAGDKKIDIIKALREVTTLGLKEAKDLVDGAPKIVKDGATKEEAEKIKARLEAAGAVVTIK